jgi:hypothetical protein
MASSLRSSRASSLRDWPWSVESDAMKPALPVNVDCPECEAILRKLLDARQADFEEMREHLFEAARSSGREPEEMRNAWLSTVVKMPDDEMQTVVRAPLHAPRKRAPARSRTMKSRPAIPSISSSQWFSWAIGNDHSLNPRSGQTSFIRQDGDARRRRSMRNSNASSCDVYRIDTVSRRV